MRFLLAICLTLSMAAASHDVKPPAHSDQRNLKKTKKEKKSKKNNKKEKNERSKKTDHDDRRSRIIGAPLLPSLPTSATVSVVPVSFRSFPKLQLNPTSQLPPRSSIMIPDPKSVQADHGSTSITNAESPSVDEAPNTSSTVSSMVQTQDIVPSENVPNEHLTTEIQVTASSESHPKEILQDDAPSHLSMKSVPNTKATHIGKSMMVNKLDESTNGSDETMLAIGIGIFALATVGLVMVSLKKKKKVDLEEVKLNKQSSKMDHAMQSSFAFEMIRHKSLSFDFEAGHLNDTCSMASDDQSPVDIRLSLDETSWPSGHRSETLTEELNNRSLVDIRLSLDEPFENPNDVCSMVNDNHSPVKICLSPMDASESTSRPNAALSVVIVDQSVDFEALPNDTLKSSFRQSDAFSDVTDDYSFVSIQPLMDRSKSIFRFSNESSDVSIIALSPTMKNISDEPLEP